MKDEEVSPKELLRREMFVHVHNLRDRCDKLIESGDPFEVFNNVQSIRSISGQMEKAAAQWRFS